MLTDPIFPIVVGATVFLVLLVFFAVKNAKRSPADAPPNTEALIPPEITVVPQPLMTRTEASVYNLLRLAAQDDFLVFAQVPLWCVVEVKSTDTKARQAFLNQIALKRLDFVLVHPGRLTVVKVVELEDSAQSNSQRQTRNRLIDEVLNTAGVEVVRLPPHSSATVPEIAALLDINPME